MITCDDYVRNAGFLDVRYEPAMHLVADMLAVTNAILDEGDFITGDDVEIGFVVAGDNFHRFGRTAHIASLP